jgi:hypothetical protein
MNETGTRSSNSSAGVYKFRILIIWKRNETQIDDDHFNIEMSFCIASSLSLESCHNMANTAFMDTPSTADMLKQAATLGSQNPPMLTRIEVAFFSHSQI